MHARRAGYGALLVAVCLAGCTKNTVAPTVASKPELVIPESAKIVKKEPGPPKKPSAELCLRTGEVKESLAEEAKDKAMRDTLFQHARLAYEQALEIDPASRPARLKLARLHEKTGQPNLTVEILQECITRQPQDAGLWYELGMCYGRQKHWDSAIQCLQKAAGLEPGNATYANHLGFALARAGRYDESIEYFRVTVGEAQAHLNVAKMSQHLGQVEVARQYAQAALQLQPQLAEAHQLLESLNQPVVQASGTLP